MITRSKLLLNPLTAINFHVHGIVVWQSLYGNNPSCWSTMTARLSDPDHGAITTIIRAGRPVSNTCRKIGLGTLCKISERLEVLKWVFPKIGGFPPKSSILIGFSIIFTIHSGVETPKYTLTCFDWLHVTDLQFKPPPDTKVIILRIQDLAPDTV